MPSMYDLAKDYAELVAAVDDCTTEEQYKATVEAICNVQADSSTKGENYARIIQMKKAEAESFRCEAKRLLALAKVNDNLVERLKNNLHFALESAGVRELTTGIGKWKIAKNPPSVEITDETAIPEEYLIPQPSKVDKHKILDDFKAYGMAVPGVEIVQKESVRFR